MPEPSTSAEAHKWRGNAGAFLWAVMWHWEQVAAAIFGCAAIAFWVGTGNAIAPSVFAGLAFLCFFIACFRAWSDQSILRQKAESALKKISDEKIEFDCEVIHPPQPDAFVLFWALRLRVTNRHPSRSARNVKVKLVSIHCAAWDAMQSDRFLSAVNPPCILPKRGLDVVDLDGYSISQQSSELFDLLFIGRRDNAQILGMAPFKKGFNCTPSVDAAAGHFDINGYVSVLGVPVPSEMDFEQKTLTIEVAVLCDGSEPVRKTVLLTVPTYDPGSNLEPSYLVIR